MSLSKEPQDEIGELIQTLQKAQERLAELTGGEIDAVVFPDGESYLLREAQQKLRQAELYQREQAEIQMAILNSLPAHVALLDSNGTILAVNEAWRNFAEANALLSPEFTVGQNYLEVCERAEPECGGQAKEVAKGIESVLQGECKIFHKEYSCHSPTEHRWFRVVATPLSEKQLAGAVIIHINITEDKLAEEALHSQERLLRIAGKLTSLGGWEFDLGEQELQWSEQTCLIHRVPPGYQPSLEEALSFYAPEHRDFVEGQVQACLSHGHPFDFEAKIVTTQSQAIWVRAIGEAVRDQEGRIVKLHGAFQDLSERKSFEESLAASELRFRQLAEAMPMIVWSANPDGEIDYSNRQFSAYTGVPQHEPAATRWQGTLHPDDRERCLSLWKYCVQNKRDFEIEYRIKRGSDKAYRWFAVQAKPVYDKDGRVFKWYGTALDIHGIKELEQDATRLAERLTNTLESLTDAFFTLDHDWCFTYVNPEAEKLLQLSREKLLGANIWTLFPEAMNGTFETQYRRAVEDNTTVSFEEYFAPLNMWVEVRAYPSSEGLAVYFRDITEMRKSREELKLSEERFQLLSKATNDTIWDWNLSSDTIWWNEGFETLFGYDRAGIEPGSDSWTNRIHPEEKDEIVLDVQKAIDGGAESWSGEYRFLRADESYAHVLDRGYIIRNQEGRAVRMIGGMTDLTERKKLEQQFLRSQRMESIGTLAGGIAHDLNNVLTPIMMALDLLKMEAQDDTSQEMIDIISMSAQHGADMVRQILSFARGVEGRRVEVQMKHLINEVERIARDTFSKQIQVQSSVAEDLWTIIGDPTQLHQVLLNLCVNARDAMPEGGLLEITADNVSLDEHYSGLDTEAKPGPYVVVRVEDNGTGIAADIIEQVFDPFFTTKELGGGTGLGLSTTLGIVKSHSGFVRVYSDLGKGTRFKVYLPAQVESPIRASEPILEEMPRGRGELILVVDDEEAVRKVTKQSLESYGYRVVLAADGAEALTAYAEHGEDIAAMITDMMMPIMDGPATIQVLRKLNPGLPIIAASGLSDHDQGRQIARLGVEKFLTKPYTAKTLLQTLHQLLIDKTH